MHAHGCNGGLLVDVVDDEAGEDVHGALPVCTGPLMLVQRLVGVGEPVVGTGLVVGLAQLGGEREGLPVVSEGHFRVAGDVP